MCVGVAGFGWLLEALLQRVVQAKVYVHDLLAEGIYQDVPPDLQGYTLEQHAVCGCCIRG